PLSFRNASAYPPDLHSFPPRRSSDLVGAPDSAPAPAAQPQRLSAFSAPTAAPTPPPATPAPAPAPSPWGATRAPAAPERVPSTRSEEHTSELQSRENLVCRLLLEKKK